MTKNQGVYPLPQRNDNKTTILDCTLRDGGYYTNWNFAQEMVIRYIELCGTLGIDILELGYIKFTANHAGPYGNLPHNLPKELNTYANRFPKMKLAAMLEVKELIHMDEEEIVRSITERLEQSLIPIRVLRFAVHYSNCDKLGSYLERLHDLGYELCINIMQIDLATQHELETCIQQVKCLKGVSAIYLADSLGSLSPIKIRKLTQRFLAEFTTPIGFHAHDNMGLALHNSLLAQQEGASWIDCTISGMGRGAGNAQTEQLLPLLRPTLDMEYVLELYSFSARYFQSLKNHHGWGASPYYGIAGIAKLHPNYIQQLEKNNQLNVHDKLNILSSLANRNAISYSAELFEETVLAYA